MSLIFAPLIDLTYAKHTPFAFYDSAELHRVYKKLFPRHYANELEFTDARVRES